MAIEGLFYYLLFWFKKVQGYRLHFGRLPSAGSLRQAPFDRLPSTGSLRQAQGIAAQANRRQKNVSDCSSCNTRIFSCFCADFLFYRQGKFKLAANINQ
jgi:hypothetical protein